MPVVLFLLAAGVIGYAVLKPATIVRAPRVGSPEEMLANRLPGNFESWIRTASPRQMEAVRRIVAFQMRMLVQRYGTGYQEASAPGELEMALNSIPMDGSDSMAFRSAMYRTINLLTADPPSDQLSLGNPMLSSSYYRLIDNAYRDQYGLPPAPSA